MCGRFTMTVGNAEIMKRFHVDQLLFEPLASFNIAPSQIVPAIINEGTNKLVAFKWGLIPSWAKDPHVGSKMINARSETAARKPAFRTAFKKRRCLVVADGFYEWKHEGKKKIPYYIRLKSGELFGFAGLYDCWSSPEGEEIKTCTILTTEANELLQSIHDRMPVIIDAEYEALWLSPTINNMNQLQSLLKPFSSEKLILYPVTGAVGRPDYNTPECIAPLKK